MRASRSNGVRGFVPYEERDYVLNFYGWISSGRRTVGGTSAVLDHGAAGPGIAIAPAKALLALRRVGHVPTGGARLVWMFVRSP